eukprot:3072572-Rhodomonas_salina.2
MGAGQLGVIQGGVWAGRGNGRGGDSGVVVGIGDGGVNVRCRIDDGCRSSGQRDDGAGGCDGVEGRRWGGWDVRRRAGCWTAACRGASSSRQRRPRPPRLPAPRAQQPRRSATTPAGLSLTPAPPACHHPHPPCLRRPLHLACPGPFPLLPRPPHPLPSSWPACS